MNTPARSQANACVHLHRVPFLRCPARPRPDEKGGRHVETVDSTKQKGHAPGVSLIQNYFLNPNFAITARYLLRSICVRYFSMLFRLPTMISNPRREE